MPAVCQATGKDSLVERGCDLVTDQDPAQGHVSGVASLGEDDQVGVDPPTVDGQPLAGAAETGHDLVGDVDDAVLVAQRAYPLEVAGRWYEDACSPHHGLDQYGGDRGGALELDHLFQVSQRALALLRLVLGPERRPVQVGAEEVDVTVGELVRPAPRVTGRIDGRAGVAVVTTVETEHLVLAGVDPRHADRVLGGVRATVGEEHLVVSFGCQFRDGAGRAAADQRCVLWGQRDLDSRLLLDRCHDGRVLMAHVRIDQLAGEVQITVALEVPDSTAGARREHPRIQGALGAPRMEHMGAVEVEGLGIAAVSHGGVHRDFAHAGSLRPPLWGFAGYGGEGGA